MQFLIVGVIDISEAGAHVRCISAIVDLSLFEPPAALEVAETLTVANQDYTIVTSKTEDLTFEEEADKETFKAFLRGAGKNQFIIE